MAFKFKAGKPSELNSECVEAGDYKLRVIEATEDTSKTGNDMIKLKLRILRADGRDGPAMFDYLVMADSSFWKIDQFLKACGKHPGEGESADLDAAEMVGWECQAKLKVDNFESKNGDTRKANKVENYLFSEEQF